MATAHAELRQTGQMPLAGVFAPDACGHVTLPPLNSAAVAAPALPAAAGFHLHNRRYIGNKTKLCDWIFSIILRDCRGSSFADVFAGTGAVAAAAGAHFDHILVNDFLHSNQMIYRAFFGDDDYDAAKIAAMIAGFNDLRGAALPDNYFSRHFGGKFFSDDSARRIGHIREAIEGARPQLTEREYCMLVAALLYSADKIANTVGHYDAYFKKSHVRDHFVLRPIIPLAMPSVQILRQDANALARQIRADVAYIDPPYNSRQYSRFYHILETLARWHKPPLHGVALKPSPENMSDYCRVGAAAKFRALVADLNADYLAVSYNNTYAAAKSRSSQNRIGLDDIFAILSAKGKTAVHEKRYRYFTAGATSFDDHKEYLFVTHVGR